MTAQGADISHVLRSVARLTTSWPGRAVGPHGAARLLNSGGSLPPILWFYNAELEPVNFHAALSPEQPLVALRSLNIIMKASPERDVIGAEMARQVAEALTDLLPEEIALVGGNCQGAPYSFHCANRLLELGHRIRSVAAIDTIPDCAVPVPALLNFGAESPEWNPFHDDFSLTHERVARLFPVYRQSSLPCAHGQYFRPENIPYLIANIESVIGARILAEELQ
ncbi:MULTISPECIES: hypothetical protein [Ponticoccus]|uniref:Thioesterase domain-containing protein n=1 Tax=Ponticoccus litoralis TaxID=422297 RepID=A0AAW9SHX5_9RHOB